MANLTPITQGMQQGAQAIQNNFSAINSQLVVDTSSASYVKGTEHDYVSSGSFGLYRKGTHVRLSGYLKLKQEWYTNTRLENIPSGFTPINAVQVPVFNANGTSTTLARIDPSNPSILGLNDITAGSYIFFETGWETNDPMPS